MVFYFLFNVTFYLNNYGQFLLSIRDSSRTGLVLTPNKKSDHLKNCHPKLEWGNNSSGGISWGDNSSGGNLWGDDSSGGNYEEKTMKQAII